MSIQELDENLRQFYAEARNRNGENYSRATLLSLRNDIKRFLNAPPNNRGISFNKDPRFVLSNQMLDAKIKQLKKDGLQNTTHKLVIEQEDLTTKNHPGGVFDVESYEKNGRMYKTNNPTDGYSALELFLSKLNPECEALFKYPKRNWRSSDKIWYENRPLGINKLSTMMKNISSAAGLSRIYTNHSVRATAITLWSTADHNEPDALSNQKTPRDPAEIPVF